MRATTLGNLIQNKTTQFITGLAIAFLGLFLFAGLSPHTVHADCGGNNDIICGGVSSPQNFISTVKGSSELQHIYADSDYGLTQSMYSNFASNAQHGYTTRGGGVYLDNGRKVGDDATSIGRNASLQGSGYFTKHIAGAGTYYGNSNDKAFAAGTDRLSVYILFDSSGKADFVVITSCGNPVHFTPTPPPPSQPKPVSPVYTCQQLTGSLTNSTNNTYTFTVTGTYANGVSPDYALFTYSDKQIQKVNMTGKTAQASRTFSTGAGSSATYAVSVTLYFRNLVGQSYHATSSACQKQFSVSIPYCAALTGKLLDNTNRTIQFTATAVLNGRTLQSATFNYGDGSSVTVKPTTATTAVVTHSYGSAMYNAVATLRFVGSNGVYTAPNCSAVCQANAKGCASECKPGIPVGDVRCNPCPTNPNVTADSPECQVVPPTLPNTGAGNTVAIFSAVVVGGFLIYRQVLYRQHKRAFVAAERGTSPLPLADPLDSEAPLAGTPLAVRARRSFRRNRPF